MSNRLPSVQSDLEMRLKELAKEAGAARRQGDGPAYSKLKDEAWDLLPEPKTEWDYFPQTISRTSVEVLPSLGDCNELDKWIDRLYATHFDEARETVYTNLVVCHSLYQCGREADAQKIAQKVLDMHGPRWFTGEYRPYLDLAKQ